MSSCVRVLGCCDLIYMIGYQYIVLATSMPHCHCVAPGPSFVSRWEMHSRGVQTGFPMILPGGYSSLFYVKIQGGVSHVKNLARWGNWSVKITAIWDFLEFEISHHTPKTDKCSDANFIITGGSRLSTTAFCVTSVDKVIIMTALGFQYICACIKM